MKEYELEKIIEKGTIDEIREQIKIHFHSIPHTRSFRLLLNRMHKMEKKINDLQQALK